VPSARSKAKPKANFKLAFEAIGVPWQIEIFEPVAKPTKLEATIRARIEDFDVAYSRFRPDSMVSRIAQRAGEYELPADASELFNTYRQLYDVSQGAVTPLIGQVMIDAGYDANYSLKSRPLTKPPAWDDVISYQNPNLVVREPVWLDLGAAGKGYLVDLVGEVIETAGYRGYVIDASGDMRLRHTPQTIGLEHPDDPRLIIGQVELSNGSLCGSATNRRRWGQYHHIIDPHSLRSVQGMKACWIYADSTIMADGLATAIFFTPVARLQTIFQFEYAYVLDDNTCIHSDDFPGMFFE